MRRGKKGTWPAALCTAALILCGMPALAEGDVTDPLIVFTPGPGIPPAVPGVPPTSGFESPCGVAVDSSGNFYVSDYHHHAIDVFNSTATLITQITNVDPLDGPCALALDAAGGLYVNDYHRDVAKFTPSVFPPSSLTTYGLGPAIESANPTGVAIDPASGNVYVNDRTYIAVYDSSGAPLPGEGGEPLRIGLGSLGDGYGLAVSGFPATAGRIYVADAEDGTVKVYDPVSDTADPVMTIEGPGQGFVSLRDSALAVDRVRGEIYVADNLEPQYSDAPEATIHVFTSGGGYKGHLKHNIIDAAPPGLAVDNSALVSQGRVYVTSGNTSKASVYVYLPGAATTNPALPVPGGAGGASSATGSSTPVGTAGRAVSQAPIPAGASNAAPSTAFPGRAGRPSRHAQRRRKARRGRAATKRAGHRQARGRLDG